MKPVAALSWNDALWLASRDMCLAQGEAGETGHKGVDGSRPEERIRRWGQDNFSGENLQYGTVPAEAVIMQLFVDDGIKSRGHRKNIVQAGFHFHGVAVCDHVKYGKMAALDYAGEIKNNAKTQELI